MAGNRDLMLQISPKVGVILTAMPIEPSSILLMQAQSMQCMAQDIYCMIIDALRLAITIANLFS